MFGRLSFDSIATDPIVWAAVGLTASVFVLATGWLIYKYGFLWFFRGLIYMWKNWLTSLDHKKIGVMYLVIAAFMLFSWWRRCRYASVSANCSRKRR